MNDTPYAKREIDQLFKSLDEKQGERHEVMSQRMDVFESNTSTSLEEIKGLQRYTNGKVRKLIIALVLIGGIVVGQTFGNMHDIINLLVQAL